MTPDLYEPRDTDAPGFLGFLASAHLAQLVHTNRTLFWGLPGSRRRLTDSHCFFCLASLYEQCPGHPLSLLPTIPDGGGKLQQLS